MHFDFCHAIAGISAPAVTAGTTTRLVASIAVTNPDAVPARASERDVAFVEARRLEPHGVAPSAAGVPIFTVAIVDEVGIPSTEDDVVPAVRTDPLEVVPAVSTCDEIVPRITGGDIVAGPAEDPIVPRLA